MFFSQAEYRVSLDPTVDEVKKLCLSCRKNARNERVLFHYNGHGVPRPTINGEIWLFNKVIPPMTVYREAVFFILQCFLFYKVFG